MTFSTKALVYAQVELQHCFITDESLNKWSKQSLVYYYQPELLAPGFISFSLITIDLFSQMLSSGTDGRLRLLHESCRVCLCLESDALY